MLPKWFDRNSKEWRKLVTWIGATVGTPFVAYFFIADATPALEFDGPTISILLICWVAVGLLIWKFVRTNMN